LEFNKDGWGESGDFIANQQLGIPTGQDIEEKVILQ